MKYVCFSNCECFRLTGEFSYTLSLKVVVMLGHVASAGVSRRNFFYFMVFQMAMVLFDWIHR